MNPTPGDEVFFRERARLRGHGARRSLLRARAFAAELGLDLDAIARSGPPVLTVVGSKGKGTTATFASALLCAAGLRVGTLTSPGYRSNRERFRVDGEAIDEAAFVALAGHVDAAWQRSHRRLPDEHGYLSPTGLFTVAGVRHFLDSRCDVMVLEAGMGGLSDEISLFAPRVVAVTAVFAEHLGILGESVGAIAADKLGVIRDATAAVVTLPQPHAEVARQIEAAAGTRRLRIVNAGAGEAGGWAPGLSGLNAQLGLAAGEELLAVIDVAAPDGNTRDAVLRTVRLPARLSVHRRGDQLWVLDAAISGAGAAAARDWFECELGRPDTVLVCLPDDKDRAGVLSAMAGLNVIEVRVEAEHLSFASDRELPRFGSLDPGTLGPRVLALGTISFAGEVLDMLDAPTGRSFTALAGDGHRSGPPAGLSGKV